MLERMETMDKAYSNSMGRLTTNLEKLTGSISDGFALLQRMMYQPTNNINPHVYDAISPSTDATDEPNHASEHRKQFTS